MTVDPVRVEDEEEDDNDDDALEAEVTESPVLMEVAELAVSSVLVEEEEDEEEDEEEEEEEEEESSIASPMSSGLSGSSLSSSSSSSSSSSLSSSSSSSLSSSSSSSSSSSRDRASLHPNGRWADEEEDAVKGMTTALASVSAMAASESAHSLAFLPSLSLASSPAAIAERRNCGDEYPIFDDEDDDDENDGKNDDWAWATVAISRNNFEIIIMMTMPII